MGENGQMNWIRGGAAVALALAGVFSLFRRWRLARIAAAICAAFIEKWRENHLGASVRDLLSKSGRAA
jgi:hypothetical protein